MSRQIMAGSATQASVAPADRRRFGRRDSQIPALVQVPGQAAVACVVTDHSEGGAFLELTGGAVLPRLVQLILPEKAITLTVEVRHRSRHGVGIQFLRGDVQAFQAAVAGQRPAVLTPRAPTIEAAAAERVPANTITLPARKLPAVILLGSH